jgi:hypothetical protein
MLAVLAPGLSVVPYHHYPETVDPGHRQTHLRLKLAQLWVKKTPKVMLQ